MKLPKAPPVVSDINVTPMVDVMLVLLIIFMVIIPQMSKTIPITLVQTKNDVKMADADKDDAIVIAVTRDGRVFLTPGNKMVNPSDLAGQVKDLQQDRSDKTVYIKADVRARFGAVTDVLDNLRGAGVEQIGFLTEDVSGKLSGNATTNANL